MFYFQQISGHNYTEVETYINLTDLDNQSFLGVLLIAAEDMTNLFIHKIIGGIYGPFDRITDFTDVLYTEHPSWKQKFVDVANLLIQKTSTGATKYILFIGDVLQIIYTMIIDTFALIDNFTRGLIA